MTDITELTYSDNPLERVKAKLLSRIKAIEDFPVLNYQAQADRDKHRVAGLSTAVAEINNELALKPRDGSIEEVAGRIRTAFKDHEAGR